MLKTFNAWHKTMNLSLNLLDILLITYICYAMFKGLKRGLTGEIAILFIIGSSLLASWYLYPKVSDLVVQQTHLNQSHQILFSSFIALFVISCIFMTFIRFIMKGIIDFKFKSGIEKTGGVITGLMRGAALIMAVFLAVELWRPGTLKASMVEDSYMNQMFNGYVLPRYYEITHNNPHWYNPHNALMRNHSKHNHQSILLEHQPPEE